MFILDVPALPVEKDRIASLLEENGIRFNGHAAAFFAHPLFSSEPQQGRMRIAVLPLRDLGFEDGATLPQILSRAPSRGLYPCRPETGLFLRLAWRDQPESANSVLSGQHCAPDRSVTVISQPLEEDDAFPKGLYLRNVDGQLWLRGYICDDLFCFSPDDLVALEKT